MKKTAVQSEASEIQGDEPRKLNMEEKRKLEKLLITDIDSATARYDAVTKEKRDALVEKLEQTPPSQIKALYERYKLARKQQKEAQEKLHSLGFHVDYQGELEVNTSNTLTKQLAEFDGQANEMRRSLATLKRSYLIKLFADHADTQGLFGSLAKDLERLVR